MADSMLNQLVDVFDGTSINDTVKDLSIEEKETLSKVEDRVKGIDCYVSNLENELISLETNAANNVKQINQKCDQMIKIIENYRCSLLNDLEKLKDNKKEELEKEVERFKSIHNIALQTSDKCNKYVTNGNCDVYYRLIGLNKIINDGYQMESELLENYNSDRLSIPSYINIDFKNLMLKHDDDIKITMGQELHFSDYYDDKPIIIEIPRDKKHQITVRYWYRILFNNKDLPIDVINIMKDYSSSSLNDKFNISNIKYNSITITDDGKIANKTSNTEQESVFGNVIASKDCVYHWQIKINKIDSMNIGIIDSTKCSKLKNRSWWLTTNGYSYYSGDGNFYHQDDCTFGGRKHYGSKYGPGDIIEIKLDLGDFKISFRKNGGLYYGYENVEPDKDYCLAIGMNGMYQQSVQILSSTISFK